MLKVLKEDPIFQELRKFKPIEFMGLTALVFAGWALLAAATILLS